MADSLVQTTLGAVRGSTGDGVHVFKGIPYAAAPVGGRRFRPPVAREPWTGVRDATAYGPSCPQAFGVGEDNPGMLGVFRTWGMPPKEEVQDEDCLVLNVWTPALDGTRPVMFRIHGGGFAIGSGSWDWHDGSNLVRRGDVVVVTVNHRLGALGYTYLDDLLGPDYAGSGNAGMLDLVAALEWVRGNIAGFGGDPDDVTIFGESGGGYKTTILLAMPPAKGLFRRAIIQSGPGNAVLDPTASTEVARAMLEELGVDTDDPTKLGELPVQTILDASGAALARTVGNPLGMAPVRQPGVIPQDPGDAIAAGAAADIPVMVGTMRHEPTLFLAIEASFTGGPLQIDDDALLARVTGMAGDGAADLIAAYRSCEPDASPFELLATVQADQMMRRGSVALAEHKLAGGGAPVFMYLVEWKSPAMEGSVLAAHGLCVPLSMDNTHTTPAVDSPEGKAVADAMSEAWLAFAKRGDPNSAATPRWTPYELDHRSTMVFDVESHVVDDPYGVELRAWPG
jgi:para-nitrobenzyl esterase